MTGSAHAIWFPDWPAKLQEVRLPVAIRQRYKLAIIRYLQFCKQSHQPATVESARQFMQQTEDARQLGQQPLEHWNEALRWFFKEGESQPVALDRPASRPENADGAPGGRALPTTDGALRAARATDDRRRARRADPASDSCNQMCRRTGRRQWSWQ
jgi:hypothetical protein